MPRTLKNTRIKGLPPRVQLQMKDAVTGSFPAHSRIASDNRTGCYGVLYDDTKTVQFQSYPSGTIPRGFDVTAVPNTYPNYFLGPGTNEGGNIILWWRFEDKYQFGGTWNSSDAGSSYHTASFSVGQNYALTPDVPLYYNGFTSTWPNIWSVYITGTNPGTSTIYTENIEYSEISQASLPNFTVSTHFKLDTVGIDDVPIFWKGLRSSFLASFELLVTVAGALEFIVFTNSSGAHRVYKTADGLISAGTWRHVAVTVTSEVSPTAITVTIYLDGVAVSSSITLDTGWTGFSPTTDSFEVGSLFDIDYVGGARVAVGRFDQVVMANREASPDEVYLLYSGGPFGDPDKFGVAMPAGLHTSNLALYRMDATGTMVQNPEYNSSLVVQGVVRKGVGDKLVTFTPGQDFQPFRDDWNPAVDAKSVVSGATQNSFYATGSKLSDVGEGFDQPLWSKTKIEIDLTPSVEHSFYIENYTSASNNHPMAYWNKATRKWEGIGLGREFGNYVTGTRATFEAFCEEQCIGFGNGMNQGGSSFDDFGAGAKVGNFGFPYHPKFHATSSNCIQMSDYIDVPFLIEKIVLEWSGALTYNSTSFGSSTAYSVSSFFVLNQRKPFSVQTENVQRFVYRDGDAKTHYLITGAQIPATYNGTMVNTIRDLVTYAQVIAFASSAQDSTIERASRELNLANSSLLVGSYGEWSGRLVMSGVVKNALSNDGLSQVQIGHNDSGIATMMLINKNSTRSGLFTPSGRDYLGALEQGSVVTRSVAFFPSIPGQGPDGVIELLNRYSKANPYLLLPGDQLVFGWQLPIANRINSAFGSPQYNGKGPELTFAAKPAKIILYGSQIKEDREHHDTLNQLLTSVTVHEVIE